MQFGGRRGKVKISISGLFHLFFHFKSVYITDDEMEHSNCSNCSKSHFFQNILFLEKFQNVAGFITKTE